MEPMTFVATAEGRRACRGPDAGTVSAWEAVVGW